MIEGWACCLFLIGLIFYAGYLVGYLNGQVSGWHDGWNDAGKKRYEEEMKK